MQLLQLGLLLHSQSHHLCLEVVVVGSTLR
jgi:hypothetical protein